MSRLPELERQEDVVIDRQYVGIVLGINGKLIIVCTGTGVVMNSGLSWTAGCRSIRSCATVVYCPSTSNIC